MKRIILTALAALVLALPAQAGKQSEPALTLLSEVVRNSPNPSAPLECLNEDDSDQRNFVGSLDGSYATSYQLCDLNADGWNAGGIGLESDVLVQSATNDLTITAPDGSSHHGLLVSQFKSKGKNYSLYAACYVPLYFISTDTGTNPLAGGVWTISLSGQVITSVSWVTRAQMTDVTFQRRYCPPLQQNLVP
jgi:hypothetical protein